MPAAVAIPLIAAGIGAGGSVASSLIGSSASKSAANQQAQEQQNALDFQKQQFSTNQANQSPFVQAGQSSIGQLVSGIQNGTIGPGSIPAFQAPTAAEAAATPGYQFTQQQGQLGIERGASAAGGAFTGGTLKALAGYNTGLANSTYNDSFNRAMQSYQAHLQGQAQGFNQLSEIAGLGENAAANTGNTGAQMASTIGNTFGNIGQAQAAGTIGSANSINAGIGGVTNQVTDYLNQRYNGTGQFSGSTLPSQTLPTGGIGYQPTIPEAPYVGPAPG